MHRRGLGSNAVVQSWALDPIAAGTVTEIRNCAPATRALRRSGNRLSQLPEIGSTKQRVPLLAGAVSLSSAAQDDRAATAAMNLDQLQQARGAYRKLLVGFLDRSLPAFVSPLVGSPAHPFRLDRGAVPAVASELPVQICGSSLKATEAILSLTCVSEAVGLPAPEMPSAIRQIELRGLAIGSRTSKPPPPPAIGRHGPNQPNTVAHDTIALAIIACLVGQFDERIRRVGRINLDLYGKPLLTEMQRPGRIKSHLQPRACEGVCGNNV